MEAECYQYLRAFLVSHRTAIAVAASQATALLVDTTHGARVKEREVYSEPLAPGPSGTRELMLCELLQYICQLLINHRCIWLLFRHFTNLLFQKIKKFSFRKPFYRTKEYEASGVMIIHRPCFNYPIWMPIVTIHHGRRNTRVAVSRWLMVNLALFIA